MSKGKRVREKNVGWIRTTRLGLGCRQIDDGSDDGSDDGTDDGAVVGYVVASDDASDDAFDDGIVFRKTSFETRSLGSTKTKTTTKVGASGTSVAHASAQRFIRDVRR